MKLIIYSILSVFLFSSCEVLFIDAEPENTPQSNFDELWKVIDEKYTFFALKSIDWDKVYADNQSLINADMTDEELFNVLSGMLFELRDGHVNLSSPYDVSRNWNWYLDYPVNFNFDIVERYYLGDNYRITGPMYNTLIDSIAYIYYGSFGYIISEDKLDYLLEDFKDAKGLIFDIRGNGGGYVSNVTLLTSKFADKERITFLRRYKDGKAHTDFSDYFAFSATPDSATNFTKPIVLLTNRMCYSAANDLATRLKSFPHITIIGDTTGGGGGLPISYELPNGWIARFSTTQTFTANKFNVELGVPPDIPMNITKSDIDANKDTYIEYALTYIDSLSQQVK